MAEAIYSIIADPRGKSWDFAKGIFNELKISGDVKGRDVFIVDDIADSGNTLVKAANVARENGARKVYAYCTHGLFTQGVDFAVQNLDKFYVGNTMNQQSHEKIEVISFISLFAEAIYRMSHGMSLSALFD